MSSSEYKFVIALNKNLETGVALNAASHMALGLVGLASEADKKLMNFVDYVDGSDLVHPSISGSPAIILRGTQAEIMKLVEAAREQKLLYTDFIETMTGGTYLEQLERTKKTKDSVYYGVAIFGKRESIDPLTKRLSLYK